MQCSNINWVLLYIEDHRFKWTVMKYVDVHKYIPGPPVSGFWPESVFYFKRSFLLPILSTVSHYWNALRLAHEPSAPGTLSQQQECPCPTNSHFKCSLRQLVFLPFQPAGGTTLTFMAWTPTKLFLSPHRWVFSNELWTARFLSSGNEARSRVPAARVHFECECRDSCQTHPRDFGAGCHKKRRKKENVEIHLVDIKELRKKRKHVRIQASTPWSISI